MQERDQQNNRNFINRPLINKSMLKLQASNSFKRTFAQKLAGELQPCTVANKQKYLKYKTQQNSPINQRVNSINTIHFPDLSEGTNTLPRREFLYKQKHPNIQRGLAKTTVILDSLMKLLKEEPLTEKLPGKEPRKVRLTEGDCEFLEIPKTRKSKQPKIIKNSMTKKFFQKPEHERNIQTEDRCRKSNNCSFNEKIEDYTFYGGNLYPLKIQTECPIQSKRDLDEIRKNRLNKKWF